MNKKMMEILNKISESKAKMRTFLDEGKNAEAKAIVEEIKVLKETYAMEKELFEEETTAAEGKRSAPKAQSKKASVVGAIAKIIKGETLSDAENALVIGGQNGEDYLIPEDVSTEIKELAREYKQAKNLLTVIPTSVISGSFTFEKDSTEELDNFDDGADIADGDPDFENRTWKISLYGKVIPVSNVILSSPQSLTAYLKKWFVKRSVVTENKKIFAKLAADKTAKAINGWKGLQGVINKDIDPGIDIVIVTNQSGFDYLDSQEDKAGRPILQIDPTKPTEKLFKGYRVEVFKDAELPNVGEKHPVFAGSLKDGGYFMEKEGLGFAFSEHALFRKNQTAFRMIEGFDVVQADAGAYVYGLMSTPIPATT